MLALHVIVAAHARTESLGRWLVSKAPRAWVGLPSGRPKAACVGFRFADTDRYCRPGEHGRHRSRGGARRRRRSRLLLVVGAGGALQPHLPDRDELIEMPQER